MRRMHIYVAFLHAQLDLRFASLSSGVCHSMLRIDGIAISRNRTRFRLRHRHRIRIWIRVCECVCCAMCMLL